MKLSEVIFELIGLQILAEGEDPVVRVADWQERFCNPTELTTMVLRKTEGGLFTVILQDKDP